VSLTAAQLYLYRMWLLDEFAKSLRYCCWLPLTHLSSCEATCLFIWYSLSADLFSSWFWVLSLYTLTLNHWTLFFESPCSVKELFLQCLYVYDDRVVSVLQNTASAIKIVVKKMKISWFILPPLFGVLHESVYKLALYTVGHDVQWVVVGRLTCALFWGPATAVEKFYVSCRTEQVKFIRNTASEITTESYWL